MSQVLIDETLSNFNVVTLSGASRLNEEDLASEIMHAGAVLESKGYPRKEIVHWQPDSRWPPSPFVAALVDNDGVTTMFIGLALEVIQAMQNAEKK
jgi:hypothetical protein